MYSSLGLSEVVLGLKLIASMSIKYNERNCNVYLGKVCAQMYTMKTRGNEPTFLENERKCAATVISAVSMSTKA